MAQASRYTGTSLTVLYFIVLVGILIFVHELGHFAWAKFFGVKVLRFSLGFGPRIAGTRIGETEYVISALPIGGYVRMLGEGPHDAITSEDESRAFYTQALWKRVVIVIAGPAMNLLFPLLLFFVVYATEGAVLPPVVGTVLPDHPADGRLLAGDRIHSIDGDPVRTFYEVQERIADAAGVPLRIEVERNGHKRVEIITPVATSHRGALDIVETETRIGVRPHHPLAVVGVTSAESPAAAAGLRTFDRIIAAAQRPVERWIDLERATAAASSGLVPISYLRPVRVRGSLSELISLDVYAPQVTALTPDAGSGHVLLRSGLEPAELYVSEVSAGSPEAQIGLRAGDRLLTLDDRPIRAWSTMLSQLQADRGREHEIAWRRGDLRMSARFSLSRVSGLDEFGQTFDRYEVHMVHWLPLRLDDGVQNPAPVSYALDKAWDNTVRMVELTVMSVVRLLQRKLSVKSLGGPLEMFHVAGSAAREGPTNFLRLMAFISINLGLINLLPIPMLDGGHLLFFGIEATTRRRIPARVREYASLAGLVVLVGLMLLAFKNDLERHWPELFDFF